jgi:hypothetical protein
VLKIALFSALFFSATLGYSKTTSLCVYKYLEDQARYSWIDLVQDGNNATLTYYDGKNKNQEKVETLGLQLKDEEWLTNFKNVGIETAQNSIEQANNMMGYMVRSNPVVGTIAAGVLALPYLSARAEISHSARKIKAIKSVYSAQVEKGRGELLIVDHGRWGKSIMFDFGMSQGPGEWYLESECFNTSNADFPGA